VPSCSRTEKLVGGSLPMANSVEIHEMAITDGVMKMRKLEQGLEIKPNQTVELKPGAYHLMFTGLREGLKQGQTIKGTLIFEKAGRIEIEFAWPQSAQDPVANSICLECSRIVNVANYSDGKSHTLTSSFSGRH
jgi:copper(I)-binding protein